MKNQRIFPFCSNSTVSAFLIFLAKRFRIWFLNLHIWSFRPFVIVLMFSSNFKGIPIDWSSFLKTSKSLYKILVKHVKIKGKFCSTDKISYFHSLRIGAWKFYLKLLSRDWIFHVEKSCRFWYPDTFSSSNLLWTVLIKIMHFPITR